MVYSGSPNTEAMGGAAVGRVTVGTTPTLIRETTGNRANCTVRNIGAADCDIGPTNQIVAGAAFPLFSATKDALDVTWTGPIYAVVASGTTTVAFFEEVGG